MPRTSDTVWKFFEELLEVENSKKLAKCMGETQGIPGHLKKHYDERWLEAEDTQEF
jgi:hypothetical protein